MDSKITIEQIRAVVEEVVEQKLDTKLDEVLKKELAPIHKTLNEISGMIDERLKKELKPINKTLKTIQVDLKETFYFSDKNYLNHEKRLRRVEERLSFSDTV